MFRDSYAKTDTGLFVLQKAALHKNLKGGDADDINVKLNILNFVHLTILSL
ncbi:MAG: hypothetical protein ACLUG4_07170 [Bacilli bacterium]